MEGEGCNPSLGIGGTILNIVDKIREIFG